MNKLYNLKKEIIPYNFLYKIILIITLLSTIPSFFIIAIYSFVVPTKSIINLLIISSIMFCLVEIYLFLERTKINILTESSKQIEDKFYESVLYELIKSKVVQQNSFLDMHADIKKITDFIKKGGDFIFIEIYLSILFLLPLFFLNFKLGLLGIFFITMFFISIKLKEQEIKNFSIKKYSNDKLTNQIWEETKNNKDLIIGSIVLENIKNKLLNLVEKSIKINLNFSNSILITQIFNKTLIISAGTIFMGVSFLLFIKNELDFLGIILTNILGVKAISPWINLLNYKNINIEYIEAEKRINNILNHLSEEKSKNLDLDLPIGKLEINILQSYPDINSLPNLQGVSFTLSPTDVLVLLGENGSGKTSLIKSIIGENLISKESSCKIANIDINNLTDNQKSIHIGYLPQNNMVLEGTLIQNIWRFKEKHNLESIINQMIDKSSLKKLLNKKNILDSSEGEIKKICLLRTICEKPRLIILDEPESYLDEEGLQILFNIISWAKNNKSILIISTNNLNIINMANKALLLENGKILKFGLIEEFIRVKNEK